MMVSEAEMPASSTFVKWPRASEGLLDTFWGLASMNDNVREDAAVRLLTQLGTQKDEQEVNYCLKRLVLGLTSSHKAARLGFYAALVHLLRLFPALVAPVEYVQMVKRHLHGKPSTFRYDRHTQVDDASSLSRLSIGICLGYAALVRSRRLVEDCEVMKHVVAELLGQSAQTDAFRELCAILLVQLLDDVEEPVFKSILWPSFREYFESGWNDCSCEKLWLILVCTRKYRHVFNKSYFKTVWAGPPSLLHVDSHQAIAKIFMRSSSSHPRVHPVCPAALHALASSSPENLYSFWEIVTDLAFGKQQRKEKAYLTLELLKHLLEDDQMTTVTGSAEGIRRLLRPSFVRTLVQSMGHQQVVLHGAAVQLAKVLVAFVTKTQDADVQLEVVKRLLFPPGSFSFDQVTHSSTISSMISCMKPDAVLGLVSLLKDSFLDENAASEMHRSSALHLLSRTIGMSTIVDLRFLVLHAFFNHLALESTIPECDRLPSKVSSALHDKARNCLFTCIASLSVRMPSISNSTASARRRLHLNVLFDILVYVDQLLRSPKTVSPLLDADAGHQSQVREMIDKTLRVIREIRATASDTGEAQAFQLLFGYLAIHLLFDDDNAATMNALKDVHICHVKLSKRHSCSATSKSGCNDEDDGEPEWILVVVDLLLSLLASASEVGRMRGVVNDVFALLVDPHLTVAALGHILDVLVTKKGQDDDDDDQNDDDNDDESSIVDVDQDESDKGGVSSSDDDDDDNDDDDDDDDEKEEEAAAIANGSCNGTLRNAVKAALGSAADDSERDDSDDDDVVLDDDAMMQLDETLAEAFRSVRRASRRSSEVDEAHVHFRHRCFDLIDAVIACRPSVSFLLRMILPLVQTVESALKDKGQVSVGQKALACLRRLCRVRRFCDEEEVELGSRTTDNLGAILRELVARFRKVSDYETSLVIAETCTFVVRCALRADLHNETASSTVKCDNNEAKSQKNRRKRKATSDETTLQAKGTSCHVDECVEVYRQTLRDYFDNRERYTPHQMFTCLVKKYLHLGWQLADVLQSYAFQPEVRLFKRTRAITMLCSLMSKANLVLQVVGADHWSSLSDDIQRKIAESLESLMTDVKPRCVAEMLNLTANVATLDRKYGRQLSNGNWSTILDAVERLSLVKELPKDAKKQIRRVRQLLLPQPSKKSSRTKSIEKDNQDSTVQTAMTNSGNSKRIKRYLEDFKDVATMEM